MVANVAPQARLVSERQFFTGMALSMGLVTLVGFAPTYYLVGLNDAATPVLTPSVHVHGALNTAWILLLILQARLIAAGRRDIHRAAGIAGAVLATAIFVSGIFVAINSERRVHMAATADTLADPYVFLIFPFASAGLFALFATLGVLNRRRAEAHKRLMLLATANLIIPALARIVNQVVHALGWAGPPGVVGAVVLLNVFLAAMLVHDLNTRGRLHPVTMWGGGFVALTEVLRFVIGFSAPWQSFARSLMG
jgi:uncharacterized membrane protein YozB (DUF420 family)